MKEESKRKNERKKKKKGGGGREQDRIERCNGKTAISSTRMRKEFWALLLERFLKAGNQYQLIPELSDRYQLLVPAHF